MNFEMMGGIFYYYYCGGYKRGLDIFVFNY